MVELIPGFFRVIKVLEVVVFKVNEQIGMLIRSSFSESFLDFRFVQVYDVR